MLQRLKAIFKQHPRFWFWFVVGGLALSILILMLLPHAIRWGAQRWLRQQGLDTAIVKAVEFNPFSGRLAVYSVFSIQTADKRMNLGRSEIRLDWRPLLSRRVEISGFTIENVLIDVNQTADGGFSIGGLKYKPQPASKSEPPGKPWEVSIGAIDLHNVALVFSDPRVQGRVDIWDAHIDPIDSARPSLPTNYSLAIGINGGSLRLNGAARPFKSDAATTASIKLAHLPLDWLGGLAAQQGVRGLGGNLELRADLKFQPNAVDCLSTVSIKSLCLNTSQTKLANLNLDWAGRTGMAGSKLSVAGTFKVGELDATLLPQGIRLAQSELSWRGDVEKEQGVRVRGDVLARGVRVTDPKQASPLLQLTEAAIQAIDLGVTSSTQTVNLAAGVKLKGLKAETAGMGIEQQELGWKGKCVVASRLAQDVRIEGDLTTRGFALHDRKTSSTLAQLDSLAWQGCRVGLRGKSAKVGGKLELAGVKASLAAQALDIVQERLGWTGDIDYETSGPIKMAASITGDGLSVYDSNRKLRILNLKQYAMNDYQVEYESRASGPRVALAGETHLSGLRARVPDQGLSVRQEDLNWKGRVSYAAGKPDIITHEGDLKIGGLAVEDRKKGLNVLDLDEAVFSGVGFKSPMKVEAKSVRLGPARMLERALRQTAITTRTHTVAFKELSLDAVEFDGKALSVDRVHSAGFVTVLVRGTDGALELQTWMPPNTDASTTTKTEQAKSGEQKSESKSEPMRVRIGRFDLDGDNRVIVRDVSAKPPAQFFMRQIQLSVGEIDTANPAVVCPFKFSAGAGRYAKIDAEGSVMPFAALPTAAIKTRVTSVELPNFSGYTQQYIGYKLMSGTLSLNSDVKLDAGILKSQNDLALQMFELERLRPNEVDALSTQLGYPVNTALAMLRDGNGDIRLKIPVDGDLRNPQVAIGGVLRKALLNGSANSIRSAVQVIYAPLGAVVSAGGKMTGQALRCKPIVFAPGQLALAAESTAYLDQLAKIMAARPGLRVSFAGVASAEDVVAIEAAGGVEKFEAKANKPEKKGVLETLKIKKSKPAAPPAKIDPAMREPLTRLANRRASTAIDYMTKHGIKSDRLFRRASAIDEAAGGKPRVEITF